MKYRSFAVLRVLAVIPNPEVKKEKGTVQPWLLYATVATPIALPGGKISMEYSVIEGSKDSTIKSEINLEPGNHSVELTTGVVDGRAWQRVSKLVDVNQTFASILGVETLAGQAKTPR